MKSSEGRGRRRRIARSDPGVLGRPGGSFLGVAAPEGLEAPFHYSAENGEDQGRLGHRPRVLSYRV